MNRITQKFLDKPEPLLSIFYTAGFPNTEDTLPILHALEEAGVDIVELGFPFSDPMADGPVIQHSNQIALQKGMHLGLLLQQLQGFRNTCNLPVVLMGYLNPVLQYGIQAFLQDAAKVGVDGVLLPDMPLDFFQQHFQSLMKELLLAPIFLVTPSTPLQRIQQMDAMGEGFLYVVSSNTITGSEQKSNPFATPFFQNIKQLNLKLPIMIGFGIKTNHDFVQANQHANGAIIGTSFIQHLVKNGASKSSVKAFVNSILTSTP
jgi:tryptophan synthase alpha chain